VRKIHAPAQELQTISVTCPFAVWGLDLLGPFKKVPEGFTHLLVAIDRFTKWIKARPLAKISSKQVVIFVQDIIFCFWVPNSIITDNITQFTGEKFLDFCDDNNIQVDQTAVTHLCTNGQVEHAKGLILQGRKPGILTQECDDIHARLSTRTRRWAAEVPLVL
jgi:hypothetical protein